MKELSDRTPSFAEKWKWWIYYHRKTRKGRFEVFHFLEWCLCMALGIAVLEMMLLWLGV